MKSAYLLILAMLLTVQAQAKKSVTDDFIYPEEFSGHQVRYDYDTSMYGYATNNGYVSVFTVDRKVLESMLPTQFALAKLKGNAETAPLIVVWGRMTDSGAVSGIDIPYGLAYNEMHFFIPGVYRVGGHEDELRTYTPRMFVDAYEPEYLGRRFFYKKIQLDSIKFDIDTGMVSEDWATAEVLQSGKSYPALTYNNKKWLAALSYMPMTDIMADREGEKQPRCSGFEWVFNKKSTVAPADVTLQINRKLTDGMDESIIGKKLESVASFRVENWQFIVDYYYNNCP